MKRNLILSIIACGASLALCPGLHAQDASPAPSATTGTDAGPGQHPWGGHHGGGESLEMLTKVLSLTADQQTQIKPILETLHSTVQATRQDTSLTQQDRMAKIKDARETANTQINGLLTADQQTKFQELLEKMKNRHHGGENAQGAPSPAASATP